MPNLTWFFTGGSHNTNWQSSIIVTHWNNPRVPERLSSTKQVHTIATESEIASCQAQIKLWNHTPPNSMWENSNEPARFTYLEHRMGSPAREVCLAGITPANTDLSTWISQANMEMRNTMKSNLLHLGRNGRFGGRLCEEIKPSFRHVKTPLELPFCEAQAC